MSVLGHPVPIIVELQAGSVSSRDPFSPQFATHESKSVAKNCGTYPPVASAMTLSTHAGRELILQSPPFSPFQARGLKAGNNSPLHPRGSDAQFQCSFDASDLQWLLLCRETLSCRARRLEPFQARDWAAAFSSQPGEFDYWIEKVEGTIPEFLQGTLFRNGPGNFGAQPRLL